MAAGTPALGRRTLFATFPKPQTYSIRPATFLVAQLSRPFRTSSLARLGKGLTLRFDGHLYVSPYHKTFDEHLAVRGIFSKDVQLRTCPRVVTELMKVVKEAAKRARYCPKLVKGIPPQSRIANEATWLGIIHHRLFPLLHEDERLMAAEDARWTNQSNLASAFSPRLTQPQPDITIAYFGKPWKDMYPMASKTYEKLVFPYADMAFPFFMSEGKGKGQKTKGENVAVNQNMNSTSAVLHSLRELERLVSSIVGKSLDMKRQLPLLSDQGYTSQPKPYSALSGLASHDRCDSSFSNGSLPLLSAVITTKKIHLDAHWSAIDIMSGKPEFYRARLVTWEVVDELHRARAGIMAAIKYLRSLMEPKLHSYMSVLETDCRETKELGRSQRFRTIADQSSVLGVANHDLRA